TDDVMQLDVGADRKLAYAVAIFVGVGITPEIAFQLLVLAVNFSEPVPFYLDGQRLMPQVAKLGAEIVGDNSVNDKRSIHFARSSKHLSSRQIPPLIRTNQSAGFQPFIAGVEISS